MHLLELNNICKEYNSRAALKGIDLKINSRSSLTIFGPNGAGKTTLLKVIAGVMRPTCGEIYYKGKKLNRNDFSGERYYLGHSNSLYGSLSVQENLRFSAQLFGCHDEQRVTDILQEHDFWERRHTIVRELSQGMKRRLAIIRGFLTNPALLVLDEPFAGLDIQWRRSVREKIGALKRQGRSLIMTTHLAEEGYALADHIGFLHRGKLAFIKAKEDMELPDIQSLFHDPDKEVKKWLF